MKLFSGMYDLAISWSRHPKAPFYLAGLSFAESSFFPIPPDVMLAPMAMTTPKKAVRLALITTLASVVGGILGYLIGMAFIDVIAPYITEWGYQARFDKATDWFGEWGVWAIFIAGFSPIPYKLFTISAGAMGMVFIPFVLASFAGRGARFLLVSLLMAWGGPRLESKLKRNIEILGWATVVLIVGAYFYLKH